MELGSQQNEVLVNNTRAAEALSHLLDNSRRTIIQVEALVTVAAALLFLQLVLGTWKRRWHNAFVSGALSVCNALLLPLVFYTLSIMQSSPVKNSLYPVWGALLLMAAGGTNAVSLSHYVDSVSKEMMQELTVIARYMFYFAMLLTLLSPYNFIELWTRPFQIHRRTQSSASFFCISLLAVISFTKVMEDVGLSIALRLSMKKNANDHQNDTDHETIEADDNYPVGYAIRCLPRPKVEVVTIDQIWGCCGDSDHGETFENVCLSLALCQFFLRRYGGLSSAQARLPITHHLVFNGLLQTEQHYERAFGIIEVELGFCYDFFFTKYHSIYFGTVVHFPLFLLRVIFLTLVMVYTAQGSVTILIPDPIVQVYITRADYFITLVLLGAALLVELLQALVYLASDWIMVSLACEYVKHKQNAFLEKLIGFLSRVAVSPKRRNGIAQHTIILPEVFFFRYFSKCNLDPIEISRDIEKAIAGSIKPTFSEQNNRLASQVRNNMFEHWALKEHWTLKDHSQVEIMLIWHIATDYCHISTSSGNWSNTDRDVAVTLSRYCAYLLVFVPQLIPYHAADIGELIDTVTTDTTKNFRSSWGLSERYQKMKGLGDDPSTVFAKGVKLGKQLEDMPDEEQRWKAMADFWAKTIIYIVPSHITAKEHMLQLENGGEFLTHIWALLSHAGILNLVRDDDEVATPAQAQPTQETV